MEHNVKFTIGTDPEFPLKSTKTGRWRSAIPLIKGTKHNPQVLSNKGLLQHDNVALEFATPPSDDAYGFYSSIINTKRLALDKLPNNIEIQYVPSVIFPKVSLANKEAQEFGCDPDINAWTKTLNIIPDSKKLGNLRSFGGHVHIGGVGKTDWLKLPQYANDFVQFLDLTVGMMCTVLDNTPESKYRRELYGKAGAYRMPPHGIEYRTPSNFWLENNHKVYLMYFLVRDAVAYFTFYDTKAIIKHFNEILNRGGLSVEKVINLGRSDVAKDILYTLFKQNICSENSRLYLEYCIDDAKELNNSLIKFDLEIKPKKVKPIKREVKPVKYKLKNKLRECCNGDIENIKAKPAWFQDYLINDNAFDTWVIVR